MLAPLLQTLDDLHALDCTHGRVSLEAVAFDPSGRATFADWRGCVEHRRGDTRAATFRAAMLDDYRAFVALARETLARSDPSASEPPAPTFLSAELERLQRGRREPFVRECEAALFALARPLPIDLGDLIPAPDPAGRSSSPAATSGAESTSVAVGRSPAVEPASGEPVAGEPIAGEPGGASWASGHPPSGEPAVSVRSSGSPSTGGSTTTELPAAAVEFDWGAQTAAVLATVTDEVDELARNDLEARRLRVRLKVLLAASRNAVVRRSSALSGWARGRGGSGSVVRGRGPRPRTIAVAVIVAACAVAGATFALPPQAAAPAPAFTDAPPHEADPADATRSNPPTATPPTTTPPHSEYEAPSTAPTTTAWPTTAAGDTEPRGSASNHAAPPGTAAMNAEADAAAGAAAKATADAAIAGDDPVAAGTALLTTRARCLASRSVPCLGGVDQTGSAASTADSAAISADAARSELTPAAATGSGAVTLRLVQTVGATALLKVVEAPAATGSGVGTAAAGAAGAVSGAAPKTGAASAEAQREPASLLLVKGEAGWRIREIFGMPR